MKVNKKNKTDQLANTSCLVYIFRVQLEDNEFHVYRDIAICPNQTTHEFLHAIRQSFGFDHSQSSAFFLCYPNKKIKETIDLTQPSLLNNWVTEPHQQFRYHYDQIKKFKFTIELILIEELSIQNYPICLTKKGIPPAQYRPEEIKNYQFDNQQILNIKASIRWKGE